MLKEGILDWVDHGLDRLITVNEEPGFKEYFQELVAKERKPIIVGNHQSHFDGVILAWVTQRLLTYEREVAPVEQPKGYVLTVASSVRSGHQSRFLQLAYPLAELVTSRRGLRFIDYTREVDEERYRIKKPRASQLRSFAERVRQGYRIASLPEASVQGGRYPRNNDHRGRFAQSIKNLVDIITSNRREDILGMQKIRDNSLMPYYELVTGGNGNGQQEGFFVPVGIHGSYRILPPYTLFPPLDTWASILRLSSRTFVDVNIGMPITSWPQDKASANTLIMSKVAQIVPVEARGVYSNKI
ncbi:hypothetical protein HYZ06_02300 [Candidatus Daviesbacteria bacterium]|nr:hypothetical protein [Candidatus Daviesbacteria bacterium]